MASGPLVGGSNGGNNDGGSREKHRWHESKVYTRKSFNKRSKPAQNPSSNPPLLPPNQTLASSTVADDASAESPALPPPPPPAPPSNPSDAAAVAAASDDDSSSLNRCPPLIQIKTPSNGQRRLVSISLASRSKHEVRDLRRKLVGELDQVRALVRKLESKKHQVSAAAAAASIPTPTSAAVANYSLSQFSANNVGVSTPVTSKRAPLPMTNSEAASVAPLRRHLSVAVPEFSAEKEKRTPKANQYYRNSDFVLGKEKFPPADSHKKSKSNGSRIVDHKLYNQAFKSCANLLQKLMKHKHGWVFNNPVDVKGLGLHDYYTIIRHPMDLGTVKSRLSKNWYKSPEEFAEDVRLTFRNAMTYNPKGQDVHVMAEQLLQIFDDQWPAIEAEYTYLSSPRPPVPAKRPLPPPPPPPVDTRRFLERSNSTVHPVAVESRPKPVSYPQTHIGRPPPLKKPKAKDLHKRDMTFDEKQKLSNNLQNLPPEKLDNIVQIIKKRNSSLSQHDDEIEVDIDSVDTETLWELDRFVTNYKKSLSKNKRKAELARAQHHAGQERVQERVSDPVIHEVPKAIKTVANDKDVASSSPAGGGKKGDNASGTSSSSSSSSGSGSSSSDSDSESSSACGSDAVQSPRT
ncbi:putative transcription factor GTE4 isoform X2 [Iris pallida]|uniref:Transcription factor GTE4 isoform X2 n=1 Tax=Iris pallida TaxID=29817 RepID=A0AAX6GWM3_IRIPA|nr:putative transcription factor GTE4 isoform X2 [Iris pallida]